MIRTKYQNGGFIKPIRRAVLYIDPLEGYAQGTFGKSYKDLSDYKRSVIYNQVHPVKDVEPEKYEPSQGVKNLKAQLAGAGLATAAFPLASYAAQVAGATGDFYTAARYAMDGQWGNAAQDALQGIIGIIPYGKYVKTANGAVKTLRQVNSYNKGLRAAQIANDVETIGEAFQQGGNVTATGYLPGSPDRFNSFNIIPSNVITMDTVPHDILAIPDKGQSKIMKKNSGLHKFTGAKYVTEVPIYYVGGYIPSMPPQELAFHQMQQGGEARLVANVPAGYSYTGENQGKKYYAKNQATSLPAATGTGNGGAQYEQFLISQLSAGVSPQELVEKKYISPGAVNQYMPYYKPSKDVVYTQPVVTDNPTLGFRGEYLFSPDKKASAQIRYATRNSNGKADPGTLNSPDQVAELMFVDRMGKPDPSKGFYRVPGTVFSNQMTHGTTTLGDTTGISQYRVPGYKAGGQRQLGGMNKKDYLIPRAQDGLSPYTWGNLSDSPSPVRPLEQPVYQNDQVWGTPTTPYDIQPIEKGRRKGSWNVQKTTTYGPNVEAATAFTGTLGMVANAMRNKGDNRIYNNQINRATSDAQFETFNPTLPRGYIDQNSGMVAPDRQTYTQFANQPYSSYYGKPPIAQQGMELPDMALPQEAGYSINNQVDSGMPFLPAAQAAPSNYQAAASNYASAEQPVVEVDGYQAMKDFIKKQEGFAKKASWDYKQFTNGYGTKAKSADEMITREEADRRLDEYLMPTLEKIQSALKVPVNYGQLTALASMAYNGGYGVVKKLINQMNNGIDPKEIANTIKRTAITVNNGEHVLPELISRRKREAGQFLQGYKVGGQYDLSPDEIKRLMSRGYELEFM